jgi:hypothetical protein
LHRLLIALVLTSLSLAAAHDDEVFRVYTEHPRLFLRPQRLKLLRKEPGRQSMRWEQFTTLLRGGVQPPEPGFAWSLLAVIANDRAAGMKAIEWALSPQRKVSDLRQMAIVYDWCQDILSEPQSAGLSARIRGYLEKKDAAPSLESESDRILAAISVAESGQDIAEKTLREAIEVWWRTQYAPSLGSPKSLPVGGRLYPLLEMLHAVRDNLNIDLREGNVDYFINLPEFHVASHYPAPYPAAENEYRIAMFTGSGDPNLEDAALSRAAGLAMVAYDTNSTPSQFLQGWLIQDRFLLRGAFGCPYEFLWANPYQPGLAYVHLPLVFHDRRAGTLFARSTWEEDAVWFGLISGQTQLFENGTITSLKGNAKGGGSIDLGSALILQGRPVMRFAAENEHILVVGEPADMPFDVETDDEEMHEAKSDSSGILEFKLPKDRKTEMRIHGIMTAPSKEKP